MLGGRGKLPVLAQISGPVTGGSPVHSLRRADFEALAGVRAGLEGEGVVLVAGDAELPAGIALAGAAGAAGRRVALLECDLLLPRLAAALGLAPKPGLHEYLRWQASATEILQPLALAGPAAGGAAHPLVCIVAGERAPQPVALGELASFRHAIAKLRAAYDQVFLVGPPLDSHRGSLKAIAAEADTLLAAVTPEAIAGRQGRALRAHLRKLPVKVRGALVVGEP
jgi:MinD-like ATPase involved in chromosome partitioning or flagellar assembly